VPILHVIAIVLGAVWLTALLAWLVIELMGGENAAQDQDEG